MGAKSLHACCLQIVIELYRLLEKVNREVQFLHHTDTICDFLYPFLTREHAKH